MYSRIQSLEILQNEGNNLVKLRFVDKEGVVGEPQLMQYIDFSEITQAGNIDFEKVLILNFSNKDRKITFDKFVCHDCIFFSPNMIDLSGIKIKGEADFSGSIFIAPEINFENTIFAAGVNFYSVIFRTEKLNFNKAAFVEGNVSFKNSILSGEKLFEEMLFGEGEKDFSAVDFGNGDLSFHGTRFGKGRKLFRSVVFGEGKKDFSRVDFSDGDISFERAEFNSGDIIFRSANFADGKKDFRRCNFGDGKKSFINTDFGRGNIEFVSCNFGTGKISFKVANFRKGNVDFHYSHFGDGDVLFDKTSFGEGNIDFRAVDFDKCRVLFNRVENTEGDIIFEASQFKSGYINFKNSIFGKGNFNFQNAHLDDADIIIQNVDFGVGNISFRHGRFRDLILKSSQINNYFDLRVSHCRKIDLSDCVIKDIVDLEDSGSKIEIEHLDMSGVRLLGLIYIDWHRLNLKKLILQQEHSLTAKAEQFRMLKENFRNLGKYEEEDLAYVAFKRIEAKAKLKDKKEKSFWSALGARFVYAGKVLVLDWMGQYATNPIRVLGSMAVIYMLFSFVYLGLEIYSGTPQIVSSLFEPGSPHILSQVSRAFYHSAITFLTIGYGDYYPDGASRWLSAIEGFIGLFMMSYFTVAFVRKILR